MLDASDTWKDASIELMRSTVGGDHRAQPYRPTIDPGMAPVNRPPWGGGLVPVPLDAIERRIVGSLPALLGDPEAMATTIGRHRAWAEAFGRRADPTLGDGFDLAVTGLTLLHATRRVGDERDRALKRAGASAHSGRTYTLAPAAIALCIDLDARDAFHPPHPDRVDGWSAARRTSPGRPLPRIFGMLGRAGREQNGLVRAIARFQFMRDASGLGVGMDPDMVAGVRIAIDGLVLLLAVRPAATSAEAHAKAAILADRPRREDDHVHAVIAMCLEHDRIALGAAG